MSNPWDDMRAAVAQATTVLRAADNFANDMGRLLRGRLRFVNSEHLAALKRELQGFDAQRKVWKS